MGIENPVHLLFVAVVALVVLGPKRLPELARTLGHGIREFREAVNNPDRPPEPPPAAHEPPPAAHEPVPAAHEPVRPPEPVDPT
jgi:sec-independent protein translocase protein TatA